ncbi:hypothetical protein [Oceaniglobus trochenteri]|uniref:hypothetical protein n=1 Tax=Oceaniglobus trochenteri TaxID=2763260 RepID=UPI001CFFB0EB|nr:hypothetical protein [Oceaniglobus trochenteri]
MIGRMSTMGLIASGLMVGCTQTRIVEERALLGGGIVAKARCKGAFTCPTDARDAIVAQCASRDFELTDFTRLYSDDSYTFLFVCEESEKETK